MAQGVHAQMVRLCLVFTYIWQEDVVKIPKVPGVHTMQTGLSNNMVGIGLTIYRAIFQLQFTSISLVFMQQNTFDKKIS